MDINFFYLRIDLNFPFTKCLFRVWLMPFAIYLLCLSVRLSQLNEWMKEIESKSKKKVRIFSYFFELAIVDLISWLINAIFVINCNLYVYISRVTCDIFFVVVGGFFHKFIAFVSLSPVIGERVTPWRRQFQLRLHFSSDVLFVIATPITPSR